MWDRAAWTDLHGLMDCGPEPIDDYADLCRRHAQMCRRLVTVAEPMLARVELSYVQNRLEYWRSSARGWRERLCTASNSAVSIIDRQGVILSKMSILHWRSERRAIAARMEKEGRV